MDPSIRVEHLSKTYRLYGKASDRLLEAIHPLRRKYHTEFRALSDVSFSVPRGEAVGIIGKNGSGKSTLLKIITGVATATAGKVVTHGRISALLELGTGFNPEINGVDNALFSGAILGIPEAEMKQRLPEILAFADIGEYALQPVRTYSSGMFVRLAFAVAIHVDPDLLIVDEALSVGDMRFQQKCHRKIKSFKEAGVTILFVSHATGAVINFCDRCLWLKDGQIARDGVPSEVVREYVAYMAYDAPTAQGEAEPKALPEAQDRAEPKALPGSKDGAALKALPAPEDGTAGPALPGTKPGAEAPKPVDPNAGWTETKACSSFGDRGAEIVRVAFVERATGRPLTLLEGTEDVSYRMEVVFRSDISELIYGLMLKDNYGNELISINSHVYGFAPAPRHAGDKVTVQFDFRFPRMRNGEYAFSCAVAEGTQEVHIQHHWVHDATLVSVAKSDPRYRLGCYHILDGVGFEEK